MRTVIAWCVPDFNAKMIDVSNGSVLCDMDVRGRITGIGWRA
jgi:hypothetical protein